MGGGSNTIQLGSGVPAGDGPITHGKQKGVKYIIKVL
jgi:hypothetical protein